MITEKDLQEAIAECQGERNPNANTCIKLAAFYTIKNELFGKNDKFEEVVPSYSYSGQPENVIDYDSGSEFSNLINGRPQKAVLDVMDELMETLQAINPRLYAGVLRRLQ